MLNMKDVERLMSEEHHIWDAGGVDPNDRIQSWLDREGISREVFEGISNQVVHVALAAMIEDVIQGREELGIENALKHITAGVQGSFHIGYMLGKEYGKGGDDLTTP